MRLIRFDLTLIDCDWEKTKGKVGVVVVVVVLVRVVWSLATYLTLLHSINLAKGRLVVVLVIDRTWFPFLTHGSDIERFDAKASDRSIDRLSSLLESIEYRVEDGREIYRYPRLGRLGWEWESLHAGCSAGLFFFFFLGKCSIVLDRMGGLGQWREPPLC